MAPIDTRMATGSIATAIVRPIGVTSIEKTSTVVARTAFVITEVARSRERPALVLGAYYDLPMTWEPALHQHRAATIWYLLAVVMIAGCAVSKADRTSNIPAPLRVPASQTLIREVQATGVQIYECTPSNQEPGRFEWTFRAPEAVLRDRSGNVFGRHYAGPTWEAEDGSKVVGEVRARDDGPDANAIPWLLLSAASTSGQGALSRTESIQRLHTAGGRAPAGGCDQRVVGKEVRVPYKADYYFYAARR